MSFEEIVKDMEAFKKKMMETMFRDFEDLEKRFETGKLRGEWKIEPFERPGMRGFIARGFFGTPEPLEKPSDILPPLKPPMVDPRNPFYDINVGEDEIQIHIELPGVEEEEIEVKADLKKLEVKARNFHTNIDISRWILNTDNIAKEYRNGILKVTIPKIKTEEHLI